MNHDLQLRMQAWLDGELPSKEASRLSQKVELDPESQQTLAELRIVKQAMAGNELERPVTESRQFYWSQIERRIQSEARQAQPPVEDSFFARWRRFLVPLAGMGVAVGLLMVSVKEYLPTPAFDETTDTSSEMETLTFHDQSAGMTVVWLQEKDSLVAQSEAVPDLDYP